MKKFIVFVVLALIFLTSGRCSRNDWERFIEVNTHNVEYSLDSLIKVHNIPIGSSYGSWEVSYMYKDNNGNDIPCFGTQMITGDTSFVLVVKRMPDVDVIEYIKTERK